MSLSSNNNRASAVGSLRKEAVERFNCCLFAKPANGTPFFEAALLVNADIGRHDLHHIEMGIDPFDDLLGSRCAMNARRLEKNRVRDAHWCINSGTLDRLAWEGAAFIRAMRTKALTAEQMAGLRDGRFSPVL